MDFFSRSFGCYALFISYSNNLFSTTCDVARAWLGDLCSYFHFCCLSSFSSFRMEIIRFIHSQFKMWPWCVFQDANKNKASLHVSRVQHVPLYNTAYTYTYVRTCIVVYDESFPIAYETKFEKELYKYRRRTERHLFLFGVCVCVESLRSTRKICLFCAYFNFFSGVFFVFYLLLFVLLLFLPTVSFLTLYAPHTLHLCKNLFFSCLVFLWVVCWGVGGRWVVEVPKPLSKISVKITLPHFSLT